MNQPLDIKPEQVATNPTPNNPSPSGDINPTTSTPGFNFPSDKPEITITLDEPATLTAIYIPTDRPNEPSNVEAFTVKIVFPNGTSETFTSVTPSATTPTETTTTPASSSNGLVPLAAGSPQVQLPPNYEVPKDAKVIIEITKTKDNSPATGVCIFSFCMLLMKESDFF